MCGRLAQRVQAQIVAFLRRLVWRRQGNLEQNRQMAAPSSVSNLIDQAFAEAASRNLEQRGAWLNISVKIGGLLPSSLLIVTLQKIGNLDLLLRAMEEEFRQSPNRDGTRLAMLSERWIAATYEVFRLLKARRLYSGETFENLERDLKLIRIPLEKHEIPEEWMLDGATEMTRTPPNNDASDFYEYVPGQKDPLRAHIMPSALRDGSFAGRFLTLVRLSKNAGLGDAIFRTEYLHCGPSAARKGHDAQAVKNIAPAALMDRALHPDAR
jgi:hypothetical protein